MAAEITSQPSAGRRIGSSAGSPIRYAVITAGDASKLSTLSQIAPAVLAGARPARRAHHHLCGIQGAAGLKQTHLRPAPVPTRHRYQPPSKHHRSHIRCATGCSPWLAWTAHTPLASDHIDKAPPHGRLGHRAMHLTSLQRPFQLRSLLQGNAGRPPRCEMVHRHQPPAIYSHCVPGRADCRRQSRNIDTLQCCGRPT